jgi:uncharacterized protein YndB with AHSA1/START domain
MMKTTDEPVVVEQTFKASINAVWSAITEIDQMHQWYFENIPSFEPEVGFETQFNVQSQGRDFLHHWKVTEIVPLKKIKYSWKYEGYPGDSFVAFELFEQHNGTKLRLSTEITEDFPGDVPEFTRESCLGGWTFFIQNRLREYFEKKAS